MGSASMTDMISAVLDDCLYNIISDTLSKVHREEKVLRMQSAIILANRAPRDPSIPPPSLGATEDKDGKYFLCGNPLKTTKETICPNCDLPCLTKPSKSVPSQDLNKQFCIKDAYVRKPGFDIYGRSLTDPKPVPKSQHPKTQKKKTDTSSTRPNSPSTSPSAGTPNPPSPSSKTLGQANPPPVPNSKCPNCPRYMAVTRIAQHMDRCLGISGRKSGRDALTKINQNGESRSGTPKPGVTKKRKAEKGGEGGLKKKTKMDEDAGDAGADIVGKEERKVEGEGEDE